MKKTYEQSSTNSREGYSEHLCSLTKDKTPKSEVRIKGNRGSLLTKLAIGAIAGATLLGAPKAKAEPIIAYENTITEVNADGLGTFGDDANDYYTVGLWVKNGPEGTIEQDTCTNLVYSTNLKDRGAYNFRDQVSVWDFDTNGQGKEWNFNGINLKPTSDNTVYYDVKEDDFLGWETTGRKSLQTVFFPL